MPLTSVQRSEFVHATNDHKRELVRAAMVGKIVLFINEGDFSRETYAKVVGMPKLIDGDLESQDAITSEQINTYKFAPEHERMVWFRAALQNRPGIFVVHNVDHVWYNVDFYEKMLDWVEPSSELEVTNAEKLSLTDIGVGQVVSVTDGFYFTSGNGSTIDGFYVATGEIGGKPAYYQVPQAVAEEDRSVCQWSSDDGWWSLFSPNTSGGISELDTATITGDNVFSGGDVGGGLVTYPAVQEFQDPSSAQGGVFMSFGTQDGIYAVNGTNNGKVLLTLLGTEAGDPTNIAWSTILARWYVADGNGNDIYYSLSDVATPDLATNWKNASDDSPASITVASVTQGELDAGWTLVDTIYTSGASQNGRILYVDVLGVAASIGWDGTKWTDGTTDGSLNSARPDIGEVNDVASEANWQQPA